MSPDNAAQDLAKLLKTINDIYPEDVVQTHLGSSARGSNAKQVPELPPATKKEAPKARKSKGMGPAKSSQGVSDTEPSSADSQASPKSVADNKKARCTVPPPLPAHAPKMQHYIAQDLQPPPRPPPGPPNMQHYIAQDLQPPQEWLEQAMAWWCQSTTPPPANWKEAIEQGGLPPGLPPGYSACPKRQAKFPLKEAQHASPIAPPQISRISPSMAGFLNVTQPPRAIIPGSQQAVPSINPRVMPPPPPPAVVPANRNAGIPSVVPTPRPQEDCRRNWVKQLAYATKKGARDEFLRRYRSWYPNSREDDEEFLQKYRRDNEGVYIRCA